MSRLWHDYIRDIREEIIFIKELFPALTYDTFMGNNTLKRAIIRSLEIIGEAVKMLPDEIKSKYPFIEWKDYAGFRDKLIHHYFGIDYEIVWDALITDIPILAEAIESIIKEEKIQ